MTALNNRALRAAETRRHRGKADYVRIWSRRHRPPRETVLTYAAVYACVTLIASDVAKLRPKLIEDVGGDIWEETKNTACRRAALLV